MRDKYEMCLSYIGYRKCFCTLNFKLSFHFPLFSRVSFWDINAFVEMKILFFYNQRLCACCS